jgi:hypothetical protein
MVWASHLHHIGDHPAVTSGECEQIGVGQAGGESADGAVRPVERDQRGAIVNGHRPIMTTPDGTAESPAGIPGGSAPARGSRRCRPQSRQGLPDQPAGEDLAQRLVAEDQPVVQRSE